MYNVSLLLFQHKIDLFGHENIPIAVKVLDYLAELGSRKAQLTLARVYTVGNIPGIRKSAFKVLHYSQLAGDQGHHSSLFNTGYILATGMTSEKTSGTFVDDDDDDDIIPKDFVAAVA